MNAEIIDAIVLVVVAASIALFAIAWCVESQ